MIPIIPTIEQLNQVDDQEASRRLDELRNAAYRRKIERIKEESRARRQAAREIEAEERSASGAAFTVATVAEIRARAASPQQRVHGLLPWASSTLVVAQRKTGKTTLLLNLARSLVTGEDLLDSFGVQRLKGRIALLNFEVDAQMLQRWADEVGQLDQLMVVDLRGCRNSPGNREDRARLATVLRNAGVEVIMVDTFARAFTGSSQNDAGEVIRFLTDLDTFTRQECGALDLVLTTHAGWKNDRTRGSSALEDWADSIITLTALSEEPWTRFISARGRDIDLAEHAITYDEQTRHLSLGDQSNRRDAQRTAKAQALVPIIAQAVATSTEPLSSTAMITAARAVGGQGHDDEFRKAAQLAQAQGLIKIVDLGSGRPKLHQMPSSPDNPGTPQTKTG